MTKDKDRVSDRQKEEQELARAREMLERTKRFLARCAEDPEAALRSDDPQELIRGLDEIAPAAEPATEKPATEKEPRTIPLRRRRSA